MKETCHTNYTLKRTSKRICSSGRKNVEKTEKLLL